MRLTHWNTSKQDGSIQLISVFQKQKIDTNTILFAKSSEMLLSHVEFMYATVSNLNLEWFVEKYATVSNLNLEQFVENT